MFNGLRTRIMVLVLLAVLPAWGMIVHTFYQQRRLTVSEIQRNTLEVARFAAQQDRQYLQNTRETLLTLAHFLNLYGDNPLHCDLFFASVLQRLPAYVNFAVALADGRVVCAADPIYTPVDVQDQPWFQQALDNRDFTIGDFAAMDTPPESYLVMAYPVIRPQQRSQPSAVVFAVMNLSALNPFNFDVQKQLPAHSTLALVVRSGLILAHQPSQSRLSDSRLKVDSVATALRSDRPSIVEAAAPDGTPALYAIAPVESGLRRHRVYVVLIVPKRVAFADANRNFLHNLLLMALVAALALMAAWFGGDFFVLKPVRDLTAASKRLAAGDLGARTTISRTRGEFGELARAFDDMAEKLEAHQLQQQRSQQALQESREQLRRLAAHIETIREQERSHIAREIHDNLGQALTALKMDLSWITRKMSGPQPEIQRKLASMRSLIDETIATVHRVTAQLRPGVLDDLGLAAAIEWQVEEFEERTGIACDLELASEGEALSAEQATAIFRILQEALTNVARHSRATRLRVATEESSDHFVLEVADNGIGIDPQALASSKSYGIIGIRERVHPWDGKVSIRGTPGQGTTLRVEIPLHDAGTKGNP